MVYALPNVVHRLPPNVSFEEGAFVQPLAIGIHTCERVGIRLGSTVLITGSGPIGLVSLLAAKAMGASKIICTGKEIQFTQKQFLIYSTNIPT